MQQREGFVEKALEEYRKEPSKEVILSKNEHVLEYTLEEYLSEVADNRGYSPKYEEYLRITGQRNTDVETAIVMEIEN